MEGQNHQENGPSHDHQALEHVGPGHRPKAAVSRVGDHRHGEQENAQHVIRIFLVVDISLFQACSLLAPDSEITQSPGGSAPRGLIKVGFLHAAACLPHYQSAGFELRHQIESEENQQEAAAQ